MPVRPPDTMGWGGVQKGPGYLSPCRLHSRFTVAERLGSECGESSPDHDCVFKLFVPADPLKAVGRDYSRRTSSGSWIEDRVTAKEQIIYKKAMGYL